MVRRRHRSGTRHGMFILRTGMRSKRVLDLHILALEEDCEKQIYYIRSSLMNMKVCSFLVNGNEGME